jgi:hypothetical protein
MIMGKTSDETITASTTTEAAEFTVSLVEFLSEIPAGKVETKAGFTHRCQMEKITGNKFRAEWQQLFTLFETQPVSVPWAEWVKKGGK